MCSYLLIITLQRALHCRKWHVENQCLNPWAGPNPGCGWPSGPRELRSLVFATFAPSNSGRTKGLLESDRDSDYQLQWSPKDSTFIKPIAITEISVCRWFLFSGDLLWLFMSWLRGQERSNFEHLFKFAVISGTVRDRAKQSKFFTLAG